MNRRDEDKIAMLAFGELDEREASEAMALAQSDPEAAKLLSKYASLKNDLRLLRDVPPEQLSTDRLRDAILGQGLKPTAPRNWFGWLWLPAGTAAVAFFAMVMVRSMGTNDAGPSVLIEGPSEVASTFKVPTEFDLDLGTGDWTAEAVDRSMEASSTNEAASTPVEARSMISSPVKTRNRANAGSVASLRTAAVEPSRPYESAPVVVISNDRDMQTGARRAFEIDAEGLQDVLVSS